MIVLFITAGVALPTFADASAPSSSTGWVARVPGIEAKLKEALKAYETGDARKAKRLTDDSYFANFENVQANMEVAIRREIGLARVAELEGGFSDLRKAYSAGHNAKKVEAQIRALVDLIRKSASELDQQKVPVR